MTYDPTATKKDRRAAIVDAIDRSDVFVERAILAIYERQTADEKDVGVTCHDNGVGFSGCHSEIGSSFAEQILANKYGNDDGRRLSPKQMAIARKIARRYSRQLIEIADERSATPTGPAVEVVADVDDRPIEATVEIRAGDPHPTIPGAVVAFDDDTRTALTEGPGGVVLTVQPEGAVDPAVRDAAIASDRDRFSAWCL